MVPATISDLGLNGPFLILILTDPDHCISDRLGLKAKVGL